MGRLENQVAVITGGARGIGYGIAQKYISEGAQVVIADILEDGPERVAQLGPKASFYRINLHNRSEIFAMADVLADVAVQEKPPKTEGKNMTAIFAPKSNKPAK